MTFLSFDKSTNSLRQIYPIYQIWHHCFWVHLVNKDEKYLTNTLSHVYRALYVLNLTLDQFKLHNIDLDTNTNDNK